LFSCSRQVNNNGRCLSFRLQRDLIDSKGFKLIEKKEETLSSPLQQFRGRQPLFQLVQLLQLISLEILQEGIKGLSGIDKLYKRKRDIQHIAREK
jgi:hypothetical protein